MSASSSVRPVALLSAAAFASAATARLADPLLPLLAESFSVGVADASAVATYFSLSYGFCQIVYGPIGDRLGKYPVIAVLTLVSAAASAAAGFADSLATLIWLRLLGGASAAAIIPLSMAYIGDTVPYERRQPVLARFLSGLVLGVIAGQACGGILGEHVGWRGTFLALAAVYLVVAIALCAELFSGRVEIARRRTTLAEIALSFGRLAAARPVRIILATTCCESLLFYGAFTFLGAYLRGDYGLSLTAVGGMLAAFGSGSMLYSFSAGTLLRRFGQRGMVRAGGVVIAASFCTIALAPPLLLMLLPIAGSGFGLYLVHNTLQTRATQMAPEVRGLAVSIFAASFFIGQSSGVALGGMVVESVGYAPLFAGAGLLLAVLAARFSTTVDPRTS
ncbi:MAG: MFS transporter [Rhodospirillaceae bacterium]